MSSAKNILKMLIGIVIFIIGIAWYVPFWNDLLIILKGTIGLFLLFVGLIVAWMGYDDYKMDIELAKEEMQPTEETK